VLARRPVVSLVLLAALGAPFVAVACGTAALVAPLSRGAVRVLVGVVAPLTAPAPSASPDIAPESEPAEVAEPALFPVAGTARAARREAPRLARRAKPAALLVSEQTVLKLAESAARPRGAFVPQTAEHPAGLRLAGVGALGIGVQDGDILVEALGISPRAPGEIIGAIIEARAKNTRFLSGTLWRRGDTFRITVEQPYLPARP